MFCNGLFSPNQGNGGFEIGAYDLKAIHPTNANWDRKSRFKGPESPLKKWSVIIEGLHHSSMVIGQQGEIFLGGDQGIFYKARPNGEVTHLFQIKNKSLRSPVIGADGTIYIGTTGYYESQGHKLLAINQDGSLKWEYETGDLTNFQPVLDSNGMVYVTADETKLHAIHPDGSLKWVFKKTFEFWSVPIISNIGQIYIGAGDENLYALNYKGEELWSVNIGHGASQYSPVVDANGLVFLHAYSYQENRAKLLAVNPGGSIKWQFTPETGDIFTSPALNHNMLYTVASHFRLMAIDIFGKLQWETKIEGSPFEPPIIGRDGTIYVGTADEIKDQSVSWIYAISPNGTKKWVYKNWYGELAHMAIGGEGILYLLLNNSNNDQCQIIALGENEKDDNVRADMIEQNSKSYLAGGTSWPSLAELLK